MRRQDDTPEARRIRDRLEALPEWAEIVIFDLEYTAWEGSMQRDWGGEGEYRELVQTGGVKLLNQPGLPEVDTFDQLSHPVFNPVLSAYFTDLTGITNDALARDGVSYAEAVQGFRDFTANAAVIAANGEDVKTFRENCGWRGVEMPFDDRLYIDLRPLFMSVLDLPRSKTISSGLPDLFGFEMPGTAHTGLGDARAIAQALRLVLTG